MAKILTENWHLYLPPLPPHLDTQFWVPQTGLEIVTDTVAIATNIFSLATKNSCLVTKVATRFLYDLDLN